MNLISDFICSVVGQRLTLILLFAAFALNLLVLVMKLAELFCRPFEADCGEADDFPVGIGPTVWRTTVRGWHHDGATG